MKYWKEISVSILRTGRPPKQRVATELLSIYPKRQKIEVCWVMTVITSHVTVWSLNARQMSKVIKNVKEFSELFEKPDYCDIQWATTKQPLGGDVVFLSLECIWLLEVLWSKSVWRIFSPSIVFFICFCLRFIHFNIWLGEGNTRNGIRGIM